jgi:hypothetical protein
MEYVHSHHYQQLLIPYQEHVNYSILVKKQIKIKLHVKRIIKHVFGVLMFLEIQL